MTAELTPFPDAGAFLDHVGPVMVREGEGDGAPVLSLRIGPQHLNRHGTAHGGLLCTLVDFALGRAIDAGADGETGLATVSLTTDFLGPAKAGDLVEAHTEVERLGGRLAFADCSLTVEGKEVVRGRAVFAVSRED